MNQIIFLTLCFLSNSSNLYGCCGRSKASQQILKFEIAIGSWGEEKGKPKSSVCVEAGDDLNDVNLKVFKEIQRKFPDIMSPGLKYTDVLLVLVKPRDEWPRHHFSEDILVLQAEKEADRKAKDELKAQITLRDVSAVKKYVGTGKKILASVPRLSDLF